MIRNSLHVFTDAICAWSVLGRGAVPGMEPRPVNEVKNVPRSVRDNPGSYRSVYSAYHHYTGGK